MQNHYFNYTLTKKLVFILEKCCTNTEIFTEEVSELIEDIVKPKIIDQPLSKNELLQHNFKIAEIKVKINVLKQSQSDAIGKRDYHTASILEADLKKCLTRLEDLQKQTSEPAKNTRSEIENVFKGLDVLRGVLELVNITEMTPALYTIYDTFLKPLFSHKKVEVYYRVLKCFALVGLMNVEIAKEYYKVISQPVS